MGLLDGKVALVTGAGHGIGRAHALELAKQGAKVVINDLGSSAAGEGKGHDADHVVELVRDQGGEAVADYGDVGDETDANAMVAKGIDTWGRLDTVINNAGIVRDRTVWNMEADDFDLVMRVPRARHLVGLPGRSPLLAGPVQDERVDQSAGG